MKLIILLKANCKTYEVNHLLFGISSRIILLITSPPAARSQRQFTKGQQQVNMKLEICNTRLRQVTGLLQHRRHFVSTILWLNLILSPFTIAGNLLVIRALWKTRSIPVTLKTLFLSLATSDLAVGLIVQPMLSGIMTVVLNMGQAEARDFEFLCPTVLTTFNFVLLAFGVTSLLSITAIAFDRLLAVSLHLRYRELVTPKRVLISVVTLWIISGVAASTHISLPAYNDMVSVFLVVVGLFVTSTAYIQMYSVVRRHKHQVLSQYQVENSQAVGVARMRKSTLNTFAVYIVFLGCYLPFVCNVILMASVEFVHISILVSYYCTAFLLLVNSLLNPFIYCWRYREIRKITKNIILNQINLNAARFCRQIEMKRKKNKTRPI